MCAQYGDPYYNVFPRTTKTLLRGLLDTQKPLGTHYGEIQYLIVVLLRCSLLLLLHVSVGLDCASVCVQVCAHALHGSKWLPVVKCVVKPLRAMPSMP